VCHWTAEEPKTPAKDVPKGQSARWFSCCSPLWLVVFFNVAALLLGAGDAMVIARSIGPMAAKLWQDMKHWVRRINRR